MDIELELRTLRRIISLQGAVIVVFLLWMFATWAITKLNEANNRVRATRSGNSVTISTISDGPFLITHLTVNGSDAGSESEKMTAALPEPKACIDSSGIFIEDITKLLWLDVKGQAVSPPDSSSKITALMLRPEYIGQHPTDSDQ